MGKQLLLPWGSPGLLTEVKGLTNQIRDNTLGFRVRELGAEFSLFSEGRNEGV
jgi:hypothetical protein